MGADWRRLRRLGYGPVFSDPPAERSVGDAVAKGIVFGQFLLGFGVLRLVRERHDRQLG
jgi:hypothetical protein